MQAKDLIDDISKLIQNSETRAVIPDRFTLLGFLSSELTEVTGLEPDFDWAVVHLDPIVATSAGTRNYTLPENFPENFLQYGGTAGDKWACKLDDGTNETPLDYLTPVQFYTRNLRAETNGRPSVYTITTLPSGRRELQLSPPPDTTAFTIDGLYVPTDWKLTELSQIPPVPGNSMILKYGVLRRIDKKWEANYQDQLARLLVRGARSRSSRIAPKTSDYRRKWGG